MAATVILCLSLLVFVAQNGFVYAQDLPYRGKTVRVLVGFPSGGGSDAEGRVLARHIGKYIPGNPTLIVQNMPGAGGLSASNLVRGSGQARRLDALLLCRQYCGDSAGVRSRGR